MVWSRTLKLSLVVLFGVCVPAVLAHSAGPSPGYTGAPGEFTCRQCHSTNPLNDGVGMLAIEGVPVNYEPGTSYTITIRLQHPDRRRWGFQMTALTGALDPAGTFTITDATHTQLKTDDGKSYVSHRTAGTYAGQAIGASWTVRWTAPATDVGPVDFYACGNAANNNNQSSGDNIYSTYTTTTPVVVVEPFMDVSEASGLGLVRGGSAIAWADFDLDGDEDALVSGAGPVQLLRNDGGVFTDVTADEGLASLTNSKNASWGDFDNDGRADLFVATASSALLFRNTLTGFVPAWESGWFATSGPTSLGSWVDYDGNGLLDLFVTGDSGMTLLHNNGDAGFSDATSVAGLTGLSGVTAAAWIDDNGDGREDLVAVTPTGVVLFRQTEGGTFSDDTEMAGIPVLAGTIDAVWADIDSDGDLDLVVSSSSTVHALQNDGFGEYTDATAILGLAGVAGGGIAIDDANGDGRLDLLVARATGIDLLTFDGTAFENATQSMGLGSTVGATATWVDADGDSHPDLFVLSTDGASLHRSPSKAQAVAIQALTTSNAAALGSVVSVAKGVSSVARVTSGGGGRSQPPAVGLFAVSGLGSATTIAVFPGGVGRQATIAAGVGALSLDMPSNAPIVTSATVKKKDDGALKLRVDGSGFATSIEIVMADGVALDTTHYPQKKRLADGTSTRLSATDSAFESMVPKGRAVRIATFNVSTGVRSAPLLFVR